MALGLPCRVRRHCPLLISHTFTTPVKSPLASSVPSGLHATDQTQLLCPSKVVRHCSLLISHHLMVVSALPLARKRPSGLKTTDQI